MNPTTKQMVSNWIKNLDSNIGDTEEEITRRRESNAECVKVRDDLKALIEYLESNDLPETVYRALNRCLNWNPFVKEK